MARAKTSSGGCTWNGFDWRHEWMRDGKCCWCNAATDEPQTEPARTVTEARRRRGAR